MVPADFPATLRGRRSSGSVKGRARGSSSPFASQRHSGSSSRKAAVEDLNGSMRGYGSSTVSQCSSFSSSKPPRVEGHAVDPQASFAAPTPPRLPKGKPRGRYHQASPPVGVEQPSLEQLEATSQHLPLYAERPGGPVQAEISEVSDGLLLELPGESRILGGRMDRNNWPSLREEPLGPMLRSLEFQVGALFELMDAHCMREDSDLSVTEVINMKRDSVEEAFQAVREALYWQQRPAKGLPSSSQLSRSGLGDGFLPCSGFVEQDSNGLQELEALQSQLAKRVAAVFEGDKPVPPPFRPPPRNVLQQQWQQQHQQHEISLQQQMQQHQQGPAASQEYPPLPSAAPATAPCGNPPGSPSAAGAEWLNQLQASWAAGASAAWWSAAASAASKACFSCQAVEETARAVELAARPAPAAVPQEPVTAQTSTSQAEGGAATVGQQLNSLGLPPLTMTSTTFHFKSDKG